MKEKELEGIIDINGTGSGYFLTPAGEDDIYVYKKHLGQALNGDLVKIITIPGKQPGSTEGRVVEILKRHKEEFVGILAVSKKYGFVIPDSKKMHKDIFIKKEDCEGFEHGEKVLCKITEWFSKAKNPNGKIVKSLGFPGENDAEINSIIYEYGFDTEFPSNVEEDAEKIDFTITEEEISKRRDFRDVLTFTIDPATAKDFDDALSIQRLDNGNIEVGVHIADVSHYVKEGSELDNEAYRRATSVYLVDRVIPMLPERLSNGVCSLRPHEEKLAFSSVFELDNDGVIQSEWFGRTVIYSDHRFTYDQAQAIIESVDKPKEEIGKILTEDAGLGDMDFKKSMNIGANVILMDRLAKKIRKRRVKKSITFNKVEVKFLLDEEGVPVDIYYKTSKDANKLIEEFMLLANRRVATKIHTLGKPFVYRTHDTPNEDKLQELSVIVSEFGHNLDLNSDDIKKNLNNLIKSVQGEPEQNMIEQLSIRTMSKAKYEVPNIGHYGLGFDYYSHFTSPIRRYPDVMVHRLLQKYLDDPKHNLNPAKLGEQCDHCSYRELNAARAERASIKFKQVEYLMDKIGTKFVGVVTGVTDWGIYVEISENKCEGMIKKDHLAKNGFEINAEKHRVERGEDEEIRLGDEIDIEVVQVSLAKKEIDFQLVFEDVDSEINLDVESNEV
ncbi:MAG: putative ribonuclease [uncultured marine phage]|uniref:exoribonuclease II n=1 Tax=uncultured marine phage TaxID=707152 RepID=A0A8D9C9E8_9VIRU|nr:MAG: putative ribonuclease [uncultured marine phage]